MNPMELLAHPWIWYALFGIVAVAFFLRARSRRLATIAGLGSGWPSSHGQAHPHDEPNVATGAADRGAAPADDERPSHTAAHAGHGGRRHGCC